MIESLNTQTSGPDKRPFIGIDFGTTKTMAASYDPVKQSAKPLTLGRGKFEMPTSIYATMAGEVLFGDDADDEGITDLPNHIRRFKMKLGKPGLAQVGRKKGTAVDLTTEFLANIRTQLETRVLHTSVDRVILTVPAMFGPAQQQDLKTAARQAGFSEVELLAEPVAAGIAYCDYHSDLSEQLRFIVVDWGGGTFDVAHVERFGSGDMKIHEDFVVGLDDIGGEVFDDELWTIASSALNAGGHQTLDHQPRYEWGKFRRDLSIAKERLSFENSVTMTFMLDGGKSAKISLNREDFNNIIRPMIQKAASFVSQLLVRANNAGCPPEFILLAGGTSRIPMIGEELERITGIKCRQWSEGREAIALGAAIKAHRMWGCHEVPQDQKEKAGLDSKTSSMSQYRELLRIAFIDGRIDKEENAMLEKAGMTLGLTDDEALSVQIDVLGSSIADISDEKRRAVKNTKAISAKANAKKLDALGIKNAVNGFATDDFFVHPHIPETKLRGAIGSYAPHVRSTEIILLHDATVFGSAKVGFILTADCICWRNGSSAANMLKYHEIKKVATIEATGFMSLAKIKLNNEEIEVNAGKVELKNKIAKVSADVLRQIVDSM